MCGKENGVSIFHSLISAQLGYALKISCDIVFGSRKNINALSMELFFRSY